MALNNAPGLARLCLCVPLLALNLLVAAAPLARAQQPPGNFVTHKTPKPVNAVTFTDGQGRPLTLEDFRGKVVLVNIWATWCGPCRHEMPSLDRLQASLGGAAFGVVALSIDRSGIEVVRKFYAENGIRNLALYVDSSGRAARELGAVGVPATLLIDREGRELGRMVGPAEWDDPAMLAFLRRVVAEGSGGLRTSIRPRWAGVVPAPAALARVTGNGGAVASPPAIAGEPR
ncbi:MAG: TlpA family protein disulfide reductase [Proteobacteria bacterium]|nr:TlpA family protein disulfide reductase [Pseudomonadota bacterium]